MRSAIALAGVTLLACGCGGGTECIHSGDACNPRIPSVGPPPTGQPVGTLVGGECRCAPDQGCRCVPIFAQQTEEAPGQ